LHTPATHFVSSPHAVPSAAFSAVQAFPLHPSLVHAFPSSQPCSLQALPSARQVASLSPAHFFSPVVQTLAAWQTPARQVPGAQSRLRTQALPSCLQVASLAGLSHGGTQQPYWQVPPAHGASLAVGVALQPPTGSHESTVQGSPSSQAADVPPPQVVPAHFSPVVQALPSLQTVPATAGVWVQVSLSGSQ
jgi:hypothetical protein